MKNYCELNDYEIIYMIKEEDDNAKDIMFEKYKPIVDKEAIRLSGVASNIGLEKDDLIQEGYMALVSSLKNYDPTKNSLFYTYVSAAIKRKMLNLIRIHSSSKQIYLNESLSLDYSISEDNSLLNYLEDEKARKPLEELVEKENDTELKIFLYGLPIMDACVFELKMNNFKTKEIAELLCTNKRNILNSLNRTRKMFNSN